MAKLPRYSSTTIPRGSGMVRASDIGSLTRTSDQAVYSGLGAFGRGLGAASNYAFRQTQERHDIDTRLQHAKATSEYEGFVSQLAKQIDEAPVETNMQRQEMHKNLMQEVDKYYQGKIKEIDNKDAVDAVKISWQKDRLRYDNALWSTLSRNLDRYEAQNAEDIIKNFIKNGNPEEAQRQADYYVSKGLFSKDDADNIVRLQTVGTEARNILYTKGHEEAESYIMSLSIDTDIKKKLVSDIRFEAAQQKKAYDQQLEQTEIGYLAALEKEELSEDKLMADLQAGIITTDLYKEYKNYVDAQAEERLKGEVELNWDTYDRLQAMVEDYDNGEISKDEVRREISKAVGKDITTTIARSLRDRLATKDKPDDPMNKASAKRAMGMLTELKNADFFWPEDEDDDEAAKRQNHLNYLDLSNELEQWITANPDFTDEQINEKVRGITEQYINDKVPGMIEKAFNFWTQSPFGVLYRKARGIEKEGKEPAQKKQLTAEIASQYLNLAGGDRKRAEQLAKDAGYEW